MLLHIDISGEQDKEQSKEWFVNTDPVSFLPPTVTAVELQAVTCYWKSKYNFRKNIIISKDDKV